MAYTFKHGDRPLDGYTMQRGIGRGGFGEVYYAISDGGREVAIKYLRDNAEIELRGVTACMNMKSPHLVSIFDVKRNAEGEYFIIMEHVAGPSLRDLLVAEPNGLGVEKATYFLCELAKGLSYLHDRGIVHRDMKPANIFYEDGQVKIGDYGLSKFISVSRHSAQTTSVGTVHYMAPEVGSGHYTRGIDIYALGVMLYEMLLGKVPFEGSSLGEILMKHLTEQPEVDQLPEPFGKVIRKALEKDPKDRYATAEEMVAEVLAVGDIKKSLAGFNPVTITNVPRVPTPPAMQSPIPSPNPTIAIGSRPPTPNVAINRADLPPAVAKRVSRISDKVERKMDKLAGRPPRKRNAGVMVGGKVLSFQSIIFPLLITVGCSLGLGIVMGNWSGREEVGFTTGLMIPCMTAGILLAAWTRKWIGDQQPPWVNLIWTLTLSLPLMAGATAPLTDLYHGDAFALTLGLLVVVLFSDWDGRIINGRDGELGWGSAFWLGVMGLLCCSLSAGAIFDAHAPEWIVKIGAVSAAATSLLVQALAWFIPLPVAGAASAAKDQKKETDDEAVIAEAPPTVPKVEKPSSKRASRRKHHEAGLTRDVPLAIPVSADTPADGWASLSPMPRKRSMFVRGACSLLCIMLLFGTIATINYSIFGESQRYSHRLMETVAGCVIVFSALVFFAQKLTVWKRKGFWLETLCPFLLSLSMIGLGCAIAHLTIMSPRGEDFALNITGIVCAGLAFLFLLVLRFKPARRQLEITPVVDPAAARAAFVGTATPEGQSPSA